MILRGSLLPALRSRQPPERVVRTPGPLPAVCRPLPGGRPPAGVPRDELRYAPHQRKALICLSLTSLAGGFGLLLVGSELPGDAAVWLLCFRCWYGRKGMAAAVFSTTRPLIERCDSIAV